MRQLSPGAKPKEILVHPCASLPAILANNWDWRSKAACVSSSGRSQARLWCLSTKSIWQWLAWSAARSLAALRIQDADAMCWDGAASSNKSRLDSSIMKDNST